MSTLVRIIKILWKIGAAWAILWIILGLFDITVPHPVLRLPSLLVFLLVFDLGFLQVVVQILGIIFVEVSYGDKLPSVENYDCKVDYILPFEGKWTVVNGGVSEELSHSWDIFPQRYAYDFIIMDDEGNSFSGDGKNLNSYYCYGENLIAPADGVVVQVSDKHKDSRVDNGAKVYCDTWDIRGNFVVIQHAEKEFSVFAHLIPGSVTVQKGDEVKQGKVIAKCGNSGNTSEPHLHFQLQTGKSFFASAGLPISFVNVNAVRKRNYDKKDPRNPQENLLEARGEGRIYIGRGLEVEDKSHQHSAE